MIKPEFYCDLKELAERDLSEAHLKQHFTTAKLYLDKSDKTRSDQGVWSSLKINDTLIYNQGTVSGKKHWISGVSLCEWVIVPAIENGSVIIILIDKKNLQIENIDIIGMENTLTVNFICEETPAIKLYNQDESCWIINRHNDLCFITNYLGISQSLFRDLNEYTKESDFNYIKKKVQLDIEILKILWEKEIKKVDNNLYNNIDDNNTYLQRKKIYSFAKKTLIDVVKLVTELTVSSLYKKNFDSHQRYKDALIYCSHQGNLFAHFRQSII
jgi:hypothetical protein